MSEDSKPDTVKVYKDQGGEYRWTRRDGGNHEIIADSSEGYTTKGAAFQNIYDTQGGEYVTDDQT